jgi:PAS domain S-box-containing protein
MPELPIHESPEIGDGIPDLHGLIEASPVAILALDASRKLRIWNAAAEHIFGWTAEEALGREAPFASNDGADDFRVMVETALFGDELIGIELTVRRRDGTTAEVRASIAPLRTPDRRVYGVVAVIADITERKHAEERSARERNILFALMDNLPDLIFVKDSEGRFATVNLAYLRFLGRLKPEDVLGRTEREIMRGNQASIDREELLVDAQGVPRWFSTTRVPFDDPQGGVAGIIGLSRDVTKRKLLETQLSQAQKLESIGHLAAGIAHEINTPIQYVSDNIAFLRESFQNLAAILSDYSGLYRAAQAGSVGEDLLSRIGAAAEECDLDLVLAEIPKAIQQCSEGLHRVSTIVKAMKEFSHPGPAEMRAVDLNQSIRSTAEVSRNEWKYIADMNLDLDPELGAVRCLPGELNQVVLNLIVNASHAIADRTRGGPEKGVITVSTRRDGAWAEIRVRDTGTGIPESVQPKIYLPFFTTKDVGKGTGQGLSIVHSVVVEKHRGTIRFETVADQGTVFIVRIPFDGPAGNE